MAIGTVAQLEEWANLQMLPDQNARADRQALLLRLLESATSMVESYCNRQFETATEERTFYPEWQRPELEIGDVQSITAISEDGEALAAGDWRLQPSPIPGRPFRFLQRLQTAGWLPPVAVTGVWGWAAVPDAVVQAAVMLANRLYQRRDTPTGTATYGGEAGSYYIRVNDPDVGALLNPFKIAAVA